MKKINYVIFSAHIERLLILLTALLVSTPAYSLGWPGADLNGKPCSGKRSLYGPYDYTNAQQRAKSLPVVENAHYTLEIRTLSHTMGDKGLYNNLDYVLRAFPNHYGALNSMVTLNFRSKTKFNTPAECYIQRALAMNQNDATIHLIHAVYLHRIKRIKLAEDAYQRAIKLQPNSADIAYNFALLLTELKRYDEALVLAQKAYQANYPLPGLKNQLEKAGYKINITTNSPPEKNKVK